MTDGTSPGDLRYVESVSPGHGYAPARASGAKGSIQLSLDGIWKFQIAGAPGEGGQLRVIKPGQPLGVPAGPAAGVPRVSLAARCTRRRSRPEYCIRVPFRSWRSRDD